MQVEPCRFKNICQVLVEVSDAFLDNFKICIRNLNACPVIIYGIMLDIDYSLK